MGEWKRRVDDFRRELAEEFLQRAAGDATKAAELAGLPRRTFYHTLSLLGMQDRPKEIRKAILKRATVQKVAKE